MLNTPILTMPELQTYLTFMGNYDPKKEYKAGDVVLMDGEAVLCRSSRAFEPLGVVDDNTEIEFEPRGFEPRVVVPMKCKCCGGSLIRYKSGYMCEYCDTEYV